MVWTIAWRQILDALLGFRFQVVLVLMALLMGTCGLLFPLKYQELVGEYTQTQKRNLEGLTRATGQLKLLASHYQTIPMRPARLGFLASGGEDRCPTPSSSLSWVCAVRPRRASATSSWQTWQISIGPGWSRSCLALRPSS